MMYRKAFVVLINKRVLKIFKFVENSQKTPATMPCTFVMDVGCEQNSYIHIYFQQGYSLNN